MIDLKLSKKKKTKLNQPIESGEGPEYPWGSVLNFETDEIKKLGIGGAKAGDMVSINAVAKITDVHVTDRDKEKKTESMGIQIQKIEIMPMDEAKKKMRKEVAEEVFE